MQRNNYFKPIINSRYLKRYVFDKITNLKVNKKIELLAKTSQILALVAILAGLVGMVLSNNSTKNMQENSIEPLDDIRASKYAIEYDVVQVAKDLKEGKLSSNNPNLSIDSLYAEAYARIDKADKTISASWKKYSTSKNLTTIEQEKLPKVKDAMCKAQDSIKLLKEIVQKKDLPELMDFVESDMPFSLQNMTPLLDDLMQIQVSKASQLYLQSQSDFDNSLVFTIAIYLIGSLVAIILVNVISHDILDPIDELMIQSDLLANEKLDMPFLWNRNDELGTLGKSFELTRLSLLKLFTEIKERNKEITLAHENICSSINYARRIQLAFLPDEIHLKDSVSDFFIIWSPKDVIGGDCYWMERTDEGCFVAVIDCTGHGVPGALMTFVVLSLLGRVLAHESIHHDPALVLNKLNKLIKDELGQHDNSSESNDGMDGALIYINNNSICYAGANIPLMYCKAGTDEIEELRPDKTSIGYVHSDYDFTFTNKTIMLEPGSRLFMVTDGITDQIGGDKKLSHGKKRLKKTLLESMHLPIAEQKEYFWDKFTIYRGKESQRDDNTMIGIQI